MAWQTIMNYTGVHFALCIQYVMPLTWFHSSHSVILAYTRNQKSYCSDWRNTIKVTAVKLLMMEEICTNNQMFVFGLHTLIGEES